MRNNSRKEVNGIVRDYKQKRVNKSDTIEKISRKMYPLFLKTKRKMIPFDMSISLGGDLYNVYLETISYSLDMFKFSFLPNTKETFSFIPYFQTMFANRVNEHMREMKRHLSTSNITDSIQEKYEENDVVDFNGAETPLQLTTSIEHQIDHQDNLMNYIYSNLTDSEWYILDLRLRSFSFKSIEERMRKDNRPDRCTHGMIYTKWTVIQAKVANLVKGWTNASCN